MKSLSIIVPMYNVEHFVERCLRSLEQQDIPTYEYEIICVNDGSPDKSRNIVKEMQNEFDNIILIDQENQGVSRARNNGIDIAKGKYLLFIDPDDYVQENSFSRIIEAADKRNAQVFFLGFIFLKEDGAIKKRIVYKDFEDQVHAGIEAYPLSRGDGLTDPDRIWAVLIERDFLNRHRLRYLANVPYLEDGELLTRLLCFAERCIFDNETFYLRTTRHGSATNSQLFHSDSAINGFILAASNLNNCQSDQNLTEEQRVFLNQPIVKFVLLTLSSSFDWRSNRGLKETIRKLKLHGIGRLELVGCSREYRIYGRIYNVSPLFGAIALFIVPRINRVFATKNMKE